MEDEDENEVEKKKNNIAIKVAIIAFLGAILAAIIGGIFGLIPGLIPPANEYTIEVYLLDDQDTSIELAGKIYLNDDPHAKYIVPDGRTVTTITVPQGEHTIKAESHGYYLYEDRFRHNVRPLNILMTKAGEGHPLIPLSLVGWNPYNINITRGAFDNECIINSNGRITGAAGLFNTTINNLQGKTLVLFFSNTQESVFDGHRMIKVHYNQEDFHLLPVNQVNIISGEYLPDADTPFTTGIEYAIPEDFDGRLFFVFYQADLNDFQITAYYR